jgi:hypothetical protein
MGIDWGSAIDTPVYRPEHAELQNRDLSGDDGDHVAAPNLKLMLARKASPWLLPLSL